MFFFKFTFTVLLKVQCYTFKNITPRPQHPETSILHIWVQWMFLLARNMVQADLHDRAIIFANKACAYIH